ncbi:MAG: AMIN domain-containing protein [Gammaproteobacteria bacterium]|nr:AMIN domain-containing protein [Gammaproteobacteria bacterium]
MSCWKTLLAILLALPLVATAQVSMEGIEFSQLPGDKIEIKMSFDGEPPSPTGYTIEQPARIALDLKGVTSALDQKVHPLGSGNARNVTVVEAGDRTRVIVALTDLTGYTTRIEGNSLYVFVGKRDQGGLVSARDDDVLPGQQRGAPLEADGSAARTRRTSRRSISAGVRMAKGE